MKACSVCLFNETNLPEIVLNEAGVCQVCLVNIQSIEETLIQQKKVSIEEHWRIIKKKKNGKYDCLIGISGGIDSSYMVIMAKKAGLNPLLVHIDGGWNHPIAITNMRKLITWSGFDYESIVLDWIQLQDAQRAFVLANVLDIDLPFENALLKQLYSLAKKHKISSILFGYNAFTEGFLPESYTHYKLDKKNIIAIHQQFGRKQIDYKQFIGTIEHFIFTRIYKIQFQYPLNWFNYTKEEAQNELIQIINWEDYGGKHHENFFTKFYQEVILPKKFNVHKRIAHLSMLICSGQMTRDKAQEQFQKRVEIPNDMEAYFCKKLELSESELNDYLNLPGVNHRHFKSDLDNYERYRKIYRFLKHYFGFSWFNEKFGH